MLAHCTDGYCRSRLELVEYLDGYYYEHAPTTPVIAEGRIHARIVHHGWQVFLTDKEKFNLNVLYPSLPLCLHSHCRTTR